MIDLPKELDDAQAKAVDALAKTMNGDPRGKLFEALQMSASGERQSRGARPTRVEVALDRGVFMISVAAELAEMHPQTLRMYEARGPDRAVALAEGHARSTRRPTSSGCAGSSR